MDYKLMAFGADRALAGEVRSVISLQWREQYDAAGEMKLVCAATPNNRYLLREGTLLHLSDRPHLLAQVQAVQIEDDRRDAKMTVRARLTAGCLADRVLMHTLTAATAEDGMLRAVGDNLRGLPLLVAPSKGLPQRFDGQISWGSVLDAVCKMARRSGLGFRVTADDALTQTFEVYAGRDRTDPSGPDYVGFFGDAAGNLDDLRLSEDLSGCCNAAIVAGEGEGAARVVETVVLSDGGPRRELYVDAADLRSTYTEDGPDGPMEHTMSPEEYARQLRSRGLQKLLETQGGQTLSASLRQTMLLFGVDYDLGDILPLRVQKYGIAANVRLAEVTLVYEQTRTVQAKLEVST